MACLLTWLEVEGRLYYGGRGQSDFTIARSARRRAQWYPPGTTDSLGTRKAKVLHQVNQVVAQSKIRRAPVDRFYARHFDLRQGACRPHRRRLLRMRCERRCRSQHSKQADERAPPCMSRRSIVRGDEGRIMTWPSWRPEARSLLGYQTANELGAPVASSIPAQLPGHEPASARMGYEDGHALFLRY